MKLHKLFPIAFSLLLTACSIPLARDSKVGVEISGINYSDQAIFYAISDPNDSQSSGGELLNPFSGGGSMCCFRLPEEWHPGIKVRVEIIDAQHDPVKDTIVDLPPYVDGKPGRMWLVHYQDGEVDVFSSDYGPAHAEWPGKVTGWPVPTLEYRRMLWKDYLIDSRMSLEAAQRLLKELKEKPDEHLARSWEMDKERGWNESWPFTGPNDPKYKESLLKYYERGLRNAQEEINNLMTKKP
jgi:hypothetical protein